MAETTSTALSLVDAISKGIEIKVTGSLPGETVILAVLKAYISVRESMDPELRKRWDAITVQQLEDVQNVWRGIWVALGVVK